MVVGNVRRELWQLIPVSHGGVFGTYGRVLVVDVFVDECQRLVATVELNAAVKLTGNPAKPLEPAVETRFELSPAGHGHLNAAKRVEWLYKACKHDLPVQSVVETLQEVAPELGVALGMNVHAEDDF